jgi:hypothetical protein
MEWRSSIETGELLTNVRAIPEPERDLAAKYKAYCPSFDILVLYAIAFVLGRHVGYVKELWKTLVSLFSLYKFVLIVTCIVIYFILFYLLSKALTIVLA